MKSVESNCWISKVNEDLLPYFHRREYLYIDKGILMWGHRIVVPTQLRKNFFELLHTSHPRIVRCKSLARSLVYWPKIDNDIEKLIKSCIPCLKTRQNPSKSNSTPWSKTNTSFERIHIDFCHIKNKN